MTFGKGYRFGPNTRHDVAVGLRFPGHVETIRTHTLQLYLEWNGSIRGRDSAAGAPVEDSGGHLALLSPGIQWVPLPQLLLEASVGVPVLQDLNGSQPGGPLGTGLPGPIPGWFRLAIGIEVASGNVYVADFYNHRIQVFTYDGKYLAQFGDSLRLPTGVAVADDGIVLVTNYGHGRIVRFRPK